MHLGLRLAGGSAVTVATGTSNVPALALYPFRVPELVLRPEARDAILRARQAGVKLAILSNELDLFYGADFRKRLPLIALFDVIVDATYTQILKPDPRAYERVLAELGLDRRNCCFVDDQKKNIEGAEAVDLPHVHFDVTRPAESYAQALKMLEI